jgi:lantibiotic biosynthesis protein
MRRSPWTPLLAGADRADAAAAVRAIAAGQRQVAPPDASLDQGAAGLALFETWLGRSVGEDGGDEAARRLEQAVDLTDSAPGGLSLWVGLSGLGLVLDLHSAELVGAGQTCMEIDEALIDVLQHRPWPGHFDLISGLVGIGAYALQRVISGTPPRMVELVLARLGELAVPLQAGVGWAVPEFNSAAQSDRVVFDVGIAHGLAGVVALLAGCLEQGIATSASAKLLEPSVRALLAQCLPDSCDSRFPARVVPGRPREATRTAWCYGDPGVAAALYRAGIATGRTEWVNVALETALLASRRSFSSSGVTHPCLCHGSAGLAHIFSRFHQWTGQTEFREAALHWYRWTLDARVPATGTGGYRAERAGADSGALLDSAFLEGSLGIGLVLLAGLDSRDPAWDRVLLLS